MSLSTPFHLTLRKDGKKEAFATQKLNLDKPDLAGREKSLWVQTWTIPSSFALSSASSFLAEMIKSNHTKEFIPIFNTNCNLYFYV